LTFLDANCHAVELQPLRDKQQIVSIRKWEVSNGLSFPSLNVIPLFEPHGEKAKEVAVNLRKQLVSKTPPQGDDVRRAIESLISISTSLWTNKEATRINRCLTTHAAAFVSKLGSPPTEYGAILELASRANRLSADSLHKQILEFLAESILHLPAMSADWFDLMFFHSGKTVKKVSLVLELGDWSQFDYPANHEAVQLWVNSQLQSANEPESKPTGSLALESFDAYGTAAKHIRGKFPKVRLPVLGDVILRAMSKESPCQKRYGAADERSFRVDRCGRKSMKDALEWLGHRTRQNRTWADARGACGYTKRGGKKVPVSAVLFSYPSALPELCPELAGLLTGIDGISDPDGVRFEQYAAPIASALHGVIRQTPEAEIQVFVLIKADKARTKVLQSCHFIAARLIESASEWQRCASNIPPVRIRQFGAKKGDHPRWSEPLTPFPAEVVVCLNTAWERAGTQPEQVYEFGIGDGLALLLGSGPALLTVTRRSIRRFVANAHGLFLALGQAHHQGTIHPMSKKYAKHSLLLPSILGLLLAKLGRFKGEYMKGPPFLVGRLLSLADQLHVQYCRGVRKGQIPPQLVGNALMATALEQPTKALALLCQRILPYKAWATTVQDGESIRLTKYLLGQLGRVCAELKDLELPTKCADADKAEMLLGYLAHSEKEADTDSKSSTNAEGATA
jgi:hypothetical protein